MTVSTSDIEGVCSQLAKAVDVMFSPTAPSDQRIEAFNLVERFKSESSTIVECALYLSTSQMYSLAVRHFGLKLMEDIIRLRWNEMSPEAKVVLKNAAMSGVETTSTHLTDDTSASVVQLVRDAHARLVVEIAKREWPQHWPTMLAELQTTANRGVVQTHVVMLTLLRLIEDCLLLQNMDQNQRRKEIHHGLIAQVESLMAFLFHVAEMYTSLVSSKPDPDAVAVCQTAIEILTALCETLSIQHLTLSHKGHQCYLLHFLVAILVAKSVPLTLRLKAATCYLTLAKWRMGKLADRRAVLVMFESQFMTPIIQLCSDGIDVPVRLLVVISQAFSELGSQLVYVLANDTSKCELAETFSDFVSCTTRLASHASADVAVPSNDMLVKFFRCARLTRYTLSASQYPLLHDISRSWIDLSIARATKEKILVPVEEFETIAEMPATVAKMNALIKHGLSAIAAAYSLSFALQPVIERINALLALTITRQDLTDDIRLDRLCHLFDGLTLAWDGIAGPSNRPTEADELHGADAEAGPDHSELVSVASLSIESDAKLLQASIALMQTSLTYPHKVRQALDDPSPADTTIARPAVLLSIWLSNVSAMFGVVVAAAKYDNSALLLSSIQAVFACYTYEPAAGRQELFADVIQLRRHAASLLIKLATVYGRHFVPYVDEITNQVVEWRQSGCTTELEFTSVVEALVLIVNKAGDFALHCAYLDNLSSRPVVQDQMRTVHLSFFQLMQDVLLEKISSEVELAKFIGLDYLPTPVDAKPTNNIYFSRLTSPTTDSNPLDQWQRGVLKFCLHYALALTRRAAAPSKPDGSVDWDACVRGGFVLSSGGIAGLEFVANPALQTLAKCHVVKICLLLARSLVKVWASVGQGANPGIVHAAYVKDKVFETTESERNSILERGNQGDIGVNAREKISSQTETHTRRMRKFLVEAYEYNWILFSQLCSGRDGQLFQSAAFRLDHLLSACGLDESTSIAYLADYRVRPVNKAIKVLVNKCTCLRIDDQLVPFLVRYLEYMAMRLSATWSKLESIGVSSCEEEEDDSADDDRTDDEIIADLSCRLLTRELMETIKAILTSGGGSDFASGGSLFTPSASNRLSKLGQRAVANGPLFAAITGLAVKGLMWPDTQAIVRACAVLDLIIDHVALPEQAHLLTNSDVSHVVFTVLKSIQMFGRHEATYIALTQLMLSTYERLRPHFADIAQVLMQVPGCCEEDVKKFDTHIATKPQSGHEGKTERTRKDMLKKILGPSFIVRDVAQQFKYDVVIKNLPSFQSNPTGHLQKAKNASAIDQSANGVGLETLFSGR